MKIRAWGVEVWSRKCVEIIRVWEFAMVSTNDPIGRLPASETFSPAWFQDDGVGLNAWG